MQMMILTLLVRRPCAAQDRNRHHRSFKPGSENITNHKRKWQDRRFFSFFLFSFLAQARSAVESEEVVNAGDERACGREDI